MALFSSHTSVIQRSKGQNAIAAAAYNSRSKLTLWVRETGGNEVVQLEWDYRHKTGLVYSKIHAPKHSPEWVYDRELLWNKAELIETRINSQSARKIMLALPIELNQEQNIALLEEFINEIVQLGMVVDANIHMDNPNNPHAHLMLTMRELEENRYGKIEFSRIKNRAWGKVAFVNWHRELWADKINEHLQKYGFESRVTHKSYKELGIGIEASRHEGPARNIKKAELVALNKEIAADNARKIAETPSLILDKLALNKPVFTKEDIACELERVLYSGLKEEVDNEELNKELLSQYMSLYTRIINSPELSLVTEQDLKGRSLYTTTKRLELEQRYINTIEQLNSSKKHSLNLTKEALATESLGEQVVGKAQAVVRSLAAGLEKKTGIKFKVAKQEAFLSGEQQEAVISILNGNSISILEGIPGAGKTTVMRELVRQYKKAGYQVIGVTPSSSAALQLEKTAGITAKNASLWRKVWLEAANKEFELVLRGDYFKEELYKNSRLFLTNRHVMIIDEASMMELANMDYLVSEAARACAKVILVGDNNQFAAVGWAGAFKKAISICGSNKLEEARRQQNPLHRQATKLLGQYRVKEALEIYQREGNIIMHELIAESDNQLIKDYVNSYLAKSRELGSDNLAQERSLVICTYTNAKADKFNQLVREQLKEAGIIKGKDEQVRVGDRLIRLGIGEQIVFNRNLNYTGKRGIYNGEVGIIVAIGNRDENGNADIAIKVKKADGKQEGIIINSKAYGQGELFDYGYGVTAYKLQGATIDEVLVAHEKQVGYEALNVMLTRHKKNVRLYTNYELLKGVMYETLEPQAEYDSKDKELAGAGLLRLSLKRVNNSFASDYRHMGFGEVDKKLKSYIEYNQQTIDLIRSINRGRALEVRKTGKNLPMNEHRFWPEFCRSKAQRNKLALEIYHNYAAYQDRLVQLGINYASIKKHAEQASGKQQEIVIREYESDFYSNSPHYRELIEAVRSNDRLKAKRAYNNVQLQRAESYSCLEERQASWQEVKEEYYGLSAAIELEQNFREVLIPEYLSRIYKEDARVVIKKWQRLVGEYGVGAASRQIGLNPALIGRLQGVGIGKFLSIGKQRKSALTTAWNIGEQLAAYNRSTEMEKQKLEKLATGSYQEQILCLEQEIKYLRKALPTRIDEEFIEQVGSIVNDYRGQKLEDLSAIIDSDLLASLLGDNWSESAQALKEESGLETKGKSEENKQEVRRAINKASISRPAQSLEFAEVRQALSSGTLINIFEKLAPMINPDGKVQRKGQQIFCGSLTMDLSKGLWHRFSNNTGGDVFTLAETALGISKREALEWVADEAGVKPQAYYHRNTNVSQQGVNTASISYENNEQEGKKDQWLAVKLIPLDAPQFIPEEDLAFLLPKARITASYEYRNIKQELLGYTIRIEEADGRKQVLPVTYCYNEARDQRRWYLKGFEDNGYKPIYGAEKLVTELKPVLIVEGEKAANKAGELLPEYTVISWLGGVGSVLKVNWEQLKERQVIIWPDNDEPGKIAANKIAEQLNHLNGFSGLVNIINTDQLGLPAKWDLADSLPEHLTYAKIKEIIEAKSQEYSNEKEGLKFTSKEAEWKKLLDNSFAMLVATGRIDIEENVTLEIYKHSLACQAAKNNIELRISEQGGKDHSNLGEIVQRLQEEYSQMRLSYEMWHPAKPEATKLQQVQANLSREICLLHQAQLGVEKLTRTHIEHIEDTVKQISLKLNYYSPAEINHLAKNIITEINSDKWQEELENKNLKQAAPIKQRFIAKTTKDLLLGYGNDLSKEQITRGYEALAYLSKYNIAEDKILASFRHDYTKGYQELIDIADKIRNAEQLVYRDNRYSKVAEDIIRWGKDLDKVAVVKDLMIIASKKQPEYLELKRAEVLDNYIAKPMLEFQMSKNKARDAEEIFAVMTKEQEFLADIGKNISEVNEYKVKNIDSLHAAKVATDKQQMTEVVNITKAILADGSLYKSEVIYILKTEINLHKAAWSLNQAREERQVRDSLSKYTNAKERAYGLEAVLKGVEEEQGYLSNIYGTLQYNQTIPKITEAMDKAYELKREGVIASLKEIAKEAVITKALKEQEVTDLLKWSKDLKETYIILDKTCEMHRIKSQVEKYKVDKLSTSNYSDLLEIIAKEQKYLSNLPNNLKYKDHAHSLSETIKAYKEQSENNIIEKLPKLIDESIKRGIKLEKELVEELKDTKDIATTYKTLDKLCEYHEVKNKLANFAKDKAAGVNKEEIIAVIAKEQEYLRSLHNNLKYNDHDQALLSLITKAHQNHPSNNIAALEQVINHSIKYKITSEEELVKQLKLADDPRALQQELTIICQEHHNHIVSKNIQALMDISSEGNKHIEVRGHRFDCPVKYLQHEIEHPEHAYADVARYKKLMPQLQQQLQATKAMENEHFMSGPSL